MSVLLLFSAIILCAADASFSGAPSTLGKEVREHTPVGWIGGAKVNIGIKGDKLEYVGNPNSLGRCDRVVFSLDLRKFIYDGKVEEAILEYANHPMGLLESNDIELEVFENGRSTIRPEDIIASDTAAVCTYEFTPGTPKYLKIDVTELVNKALSAGDGYITFRVRDVTIEKVGNTKSAAEGVVIPRSKVRLLITGYSKK